MLPAANLTLPTLVSRLASTIGYVTPSAMMMVVDGEPRLSFPFVISLAPKSPHSRCLSCIERAVLVDLLTTKHTTVVLVVDNVMHQWKRDLDAGQFLYSRTKAAIVAEGATRE